MIETFHKRARKLPPLLMALLTAFTAGTSIDRCYAAELSPEMQDQMRFGVSAYDAGDNRLAYKTFNKLMLEVGRESGASDGRLARLYSNMGEVYDAQKQYAYAEDCLKKGLNMAQKGFGASSIQSVPPLINLAQTYVHQGKDAMAQPLFKKALAIVDKPENKSLLPYVVVIETNLGAMYFAEGHYAFGEPHFKRALAVASDCLGAGHKWTTVIAAMYAACVQAGGKAKQAKAIEQAARAKANETLSPLTTWNKQIRLADDALAAKQYPETEAALKLAMQAAQELTTEPMIQALTLTRYGQFYLQQNMPVQAIEKLKAAQAIADPILGLEDKAVLERAKQLADLERTKEQYADAAPLYLRLLAFAEKTSGPDSDESAALVADLAGLYNSWGQYPKAVTYYSKLLALQEKKYGATNEKLVPILVSLAGAAQNNTQNFGEVNQKAEVHLKRAADIATEHYGKNSKELAVVLDSLGHYYQRHLEWPNAAKMCTQVITADEKNFGPNSPETLAALEHYAVVLRAAGWRDQAEPVEARIAKIKDNKSTSNK